MQKSRTKSKRIGYARASTDGQDLALQLDALHAAGCDSIYREIASGGDRERAELEAMIGELMPGDTVVVWKLDRLGRSLAHLLEILSELEDVGAHLHLLTEGIDTSTSAGRMVFAMIGAIAEYERALIVERTRAGIKAAKARGVHCGRPPKLNAIQRSEIHKLAGHYGYTQSKLASLFGVSRPTISRVLDADKD